MLVNHVSNYKQFLQKSSSLKYEIRDKFSFDKMTIKIKETLQRYIPQFPKQLQITLPKLKKIQPIKLIDNTQGDKENE